VDWSLIGGRQACVPEGHEKALFLRQWGVPFEALAYVFGRETMFWYRAWLSCGRLPLVGITVKCRDKMPQDVVADEKITWLAGAEVVVPTTVGRGCVARSGRSG
jgi:hypothetical protein